MSALFEMEPTPVPLAGLSAGAKITARQHAAVAAGLHPLTKTTARPDFGTCGGCALRSTAYGYPKCTLGAKLDVRPYRAGPYMTHGQATDCRAWWPACGDFRPAVPQ